jgi:hypothetical protein
LHKLLTERLKRYQLSATHINQFTDVSSGGPQGFLLNCLLYFPQSQAPAAHYGTAVHQTLRWFFLTASREGNLSSLERLLEHFEERLRRRKLASPNHEVFLERGRLSLTAWLAQQGRNLDLNDRYELNFKNEGSFIGDVHLTGQVDRLRVDRQNKTIAITDYKTGQPYRRWVGNNIRLHKYRQQLLTYKFLIENSRSFRGYTVDKALLEFIEPDEYGQITQLDLTYNQRELDDFKKLVTTIWQRVRTLDLPDTSQSPPTIVGIKDFEKQLIAETK